MDESEWKLNWAFICATHKTPPPPPAAREAYGDDDMRQCECVDVIAVRAYGVIALYNSLRMCGEYICI